MLTIKPDLLKSVDGWVGGRTNKRSRFICTAIQTYINHLQQTMDDADEFLVTHDIPD